MHLRVATGVCALSIGLVVGSPAAGLAAADPGAEGAGTQGSAATDSPRSPDPLRDAVDNVTRALSKAVHDTTQEAIRGVTGTLNSLSKPGPQQPSSPTPRRVLTSGSQAEAGSVDSDGVILDATLDPLVESAEDSAIGPTADPTIENAADSGAETTADSTIAPAADTTTSSGGSSLPAPEPSVETPSAPDVALTPTPATTTVAWVPGSMPTGPNVTMPVAKAIAAITAILQAVGSTPALLATLPTSATPITDVIASLQRILTSVVDAGTTFVQLPNDIYALFSAGTLSPDAPTLAAPGRIGPSTFVGPSLPMPMPTAMPGPVGLNPILVGFDTPLALDPPMAPAPSPNVTTSGTSTGVASPGSFLAPNDDSSVLSIVKNVIGAVVATVSLTALAAVALPGILGLLGTCAAGVRIGYRQAKAGAELPATAVARFVGSGPVGVVRSGSQISLRPRVVRSGSRHTRPSHSDRLAGSSSVQLLDRAV